MIALLQRVKEAQVTVNDKLIGKCDHGLLIFLGVINGDNEEDCLILAEKTKKLRIFEDENGKMNKSIVDINGSALVVSQFTLAANCKNGNRPDFIAAAPKDISEPLYNKFADIIKETIKGDVQRGMFGADMKVSLVNDGPVTIILDSKQLAKK